VFFPAIAVISIML